MMVMPFGLLGRVSWPCWS